MGGVAKKRCRHDETSLLVPQETVSSDVERARKVRRCSSWVRMALIACGYRNARVKYGMVFGLFRPRTQKMATEDVCVDTLHSSGDAEGARGRLDVLVGAFREAGVQRGSHVHVSIHLTGLA